MDFVMFYIMPNPVCTNEISSNQNYTSIESNDTTSLQHWIKMPVTGLETHLISAHQESSGVVIQSCWDLKP